MLGIVGNGGWAASLKVVINSLGVLRFTQRSSAEQEKLVYN